MPIALIVLFQLALSIVSSAAHAEEVQLIGPCESWLISPALRKYIEGGSATVGLISENTRLLRQSGVSPYVTRRIDRILAYAKDGKLNIDPLREVVAFMADEEGAVKRTLLCVGDRDCRFRDRTQAALYVKFHNHERVSFHLFHDLPPLDGPAGQIIELKAAREAALVSSQDILHILVVQPFLKDLPPDLHDPIARWSSIESDYFHELVHAADAWFFDRWVEANFTRIQQNRNPDELFQKFARISPDLNRVFVAEEFYLIFSELRAYLTGFEVQKYMRQVEKPQLAKARLLVGAWFTALRNLNPRPPLVLATAKQYGLPLERDTNLEADSKTLFAAAEKIERLVSGPASWAAIMRETVSEFGIDSLTPPVNVPESPLVPDLPEVPRTSAVGNRSHPRHQD